MPWHYPRPISGPSFGWIRKADQSEFRLVRNSWPTGVRWGGGCQGGPRNRKTAQITRHPSILKYYRCGCRETFFSSPGLPETTLFCRLTYSFYQIKRQGKYILTLYIRKVSQKGRFRSLLKYHISSKVPPSFSKFPQASHLRTLAKNLFSPHSFLAPLRQVCALLKISCQYAPVRPPTRFECF